jgi:hypothetical protein
MNTFCSKTLFAASLAGALIFNQAAFAEGLPAPVQAKVDAYTKKLVDWAANPTIVAAVKEANAKGPGAMTNGKWNDLDEKDPTVTAFQTNKAGALVGKWEDDKGINKLIVRDEKGNIVGSSSKPLIFNNASRPPFANPIKGQPWAASEVKADPTTGVKSVQAGVPVMDGGKVIGVLHAGINAE